MSRLLKLEQQSNMCDILVTLDVSRFVKSISFKLSQSANVYDIFVTLDVSRFVKSISFKLIHL